MYSKIATIISSSFLGAGLVKEYTEENSKFSVTQFSLLMNNNIMFDNNFCLLCILSPRQTVMTVNDIWWYLELTLWFDHQLSHSIMDYQELSFTFNAFNFFMTFKYSITHLTLHPWYHKIPITSHSENSPLPLKISLPPTTTKSQMQISLQ